jgi:hypothetical protein
MIDPPWTKKYKLSYLGFDNYEVIEESSKDILVAGPLEYGEAQDIADRANSELTAERIKNKAKRK